MENKKILVVDGKPVGKELARNMILNIQEENEKSKGSLGFVSPKERHEKKIKEIQIKYGLTHGKGKSKGKKRGRQK